MISASSIDLRTVVLSTEDYMLMAGAGGVIYGGSFVSGVAGQGGPDLGVYYRPWQIGLDAKGAMEPPTGTVDNSVQAVQLGRVSLHQMRRRPD